MSTQTQTAYERMKARECCCRGTGYVEVHNNGQFTTPMGNPIKAHSVVVHCCCTVGTNLRDQRAAGKGSALPMFDLDSMELFRPYGAVQESPSPFVPFSEASF